MLWYKIRTEVPELVTNVFFYVNVYRVFKYKIMIER